MTGRSPPRAAVALALVCCLTLALGIAAAPASAGDGITVVSFDSGEVDADAGETVTLELVVSDHGDYSGNGIDNLSATVAYDPAVFTVTDVEHGPMLAGDDPDAEVKGAAEIEAEAGAVTIGQERTPSGDGTKGTGTAATLTLEVADDAEPTTERIEITESSTMLITDYPQHTVERDATVHVEGGAEPDEGAEPEDALDGDDDPEGVTLADEPAANESNASDDVDEDETTTEANGDDADSVPGFTAIAAILGIATLLVRHSRR